MGIEKEYKKGSDPSLDRDYEAALPFAKVKVGAENLYWKVLLKWYYLPLSRAVRIYRRMEEVQGRTGCCSNDFSIHKLMVITDEEERMQIKIGEGLYRHEPEALMEALKKSHPQIAYGKE